MSSSCQELTVLLTFPPHFGTLAWRNETWWRCLMMIFYVLSFCLSVECYIRRSDVLVTHMRNGQRSESYWYCVLLLLRGAYRKSVVHQVYRLLQSSRQCQVSSLTRFQSAAMWTGVKQFNHISRQVLKPESTEALVSYLAYLCLQRSPCIWSSSKTIAKVRQVVQPGIARRFFAIWKLF